MKWETNVRSGAQLELKLCLFRLPVGLGKSKKLEEGESPDGRGVEGEA